MTRVLVISTGLPRMLGEIVGHALARYADVQLAVAAATASTLALAVRDSGADVVVGADSQFPDAAVSALLDEFPRVRVFTLTSDARMAWLSELRPERVALGEVSPERLAEAIRMPRSRAWTRVGHG
jgi:hypothetical protein